MEQKKFNIDPNLIEQLAKSVKTEKDLAELNKHLLKMTVERAMSAEMDEHLGYESICEGLNLI